MKRWPRRSVDHLCRRRQARLADAGLRRPVLLFFDVPLPAGLAEDRDTLRADLSRYFAGWAPPVQKLIAALDPQTTNRIEIHDIEPFSRTVRGRVALLGDAGHSTTPDIGRGGCAAMEDAVVLGAVFRQTRDIAAALREYEAQRCDRVRDRC